jgi:hypothetical protein
MAGMPFATRRLCSNEQEVHVKILSLAFLTILTFSIEAQARHRLDFGEPVKLRPVKMKPMPQTNYLGQYKEYHSPQSSGLKDLKLFAEK